MVTPTPVGPDQTLARATEIMDALDVRELPVVADGIVVGIITRRDMEPHRGHFEWTPVKVVMTAAPITAAPDTSIGEVAQLLLSNAFNSLPVTAADHLVGMITRKDLVRLLAQRP